MITKLMGKYGLIEKDSEFLYQFLGRLQSDCKYYLGYGNRCAKYLWAGNVKEHIELMVEIMFYLCVYYGEPEWITWKDIYNYCLKMEGGENK